MFHQLLTPVGDSLSLSFLVAILPIATVLVLLGILKRPAWQAALAGLAVGLGIAVAVWGMPAHIAFASAFHGAVCAQALAKSNSAGPVRAPVAASAVPP